MKIPPSSPHPHVLPNLYFYFCVKACIKNNSGCSFPCYSEWYWNIQAVKILQNNHYRTIKAAHMTHALYSKLSCMIVLSEKQTELKLLFTYWLLSLNLRTESVQFINESFRLLCELDELNYWKDKRMICPRTGHHINTAKRAKMQHLQSKRKSNQYISKFSFLMNK